MRQINEGAEMQDILFWSGYTGTPTVSNTSPAPFASGYYYKLTGNGYYLYKNITAVVEGYSRHRFYTSYLPTDGRIIAFRSATNQLTYVALNASGNICAYASSLLQDSGVPLVTGRWYLIETYYKLDNSSGRIIVYLDGTKIIDYTGDTNPGSYTTFDNIYFGCGAGGASNVCIDDFAFNDTTGNTDNGWCGDGIYVRLTPKGAGEVNQWLGSDGDRVSNWLLVDEYPKDDDTTYIVASGISLGLQEQYTLSGYSGTGKSILRIYPEIRAKKTVASGYYIKLGVLPSGGSDVMSSNLTIGLDYAIITGSGYIKNPFTSQDWTETDITDLQLVIEVG